MHLYFYMPWDQNYWNLKLCSWLKARIELETCLFWPYCILIDFFRLNFIKEFETSYEAQRQLSWHIQFLHLSNGYSIVISNFGNFRCSLLLKQPVKPVSGIKTLCICLWTWRLKKLKNWKMFCSLSNHLTLLHRLRFIGIPGVYFLFWGGNWRRPILIRDLTIQKVKATAVRLSVSSMNNFIIPWLKLLKRWAKWSIKFSHPELCFNFWSQLPKLMFKVNSS